MLSIQGKDKQKRPITTAIKIDCCLAASSSADAGLTVHIVDIGDGFGCDDQGFENIEGKVYQQAINLRPDLLSVPMIDGECPESMLTRLEDCRTVKFATATNGKDQLWPVSVYKRLCMILSMIKDHSESANTISSTIIGAEIHKAIWYLLREKCLAQVDGTLFCFWSPEWNQINLEDKIQALPQANGLFIKVVDRSTGGASGVIYVKNTEDCLKELEKIKNNRTNRLYVIETAHAHAMCVDRHQKVPTIRAFCLLDYDPDQQRARIKLTDAQYILPNDDYQGPGNGTSDQMMARSRDCKMMPLSQAHMEILKEQLNDKYQYVFQALCQGGQGLDALLGSSMTYQYLNSILYPDSVFNIMRDIEKTEIADTHPYKHVLVQAFMRNHGLATNSAALSDLLNESEGNQNSHIINANTFFDFSGRARDDTNNQISQLISRVSRDTKIVNISRLSSIVAAWKSFGAVSFSEGFPIERVRSAYDASLKRYLTDGPDFESLGPTPDKISAEYPEVEVIMPQWSNPSTQISYANEPETALIQAAICADWRTLRLLLLARLTSADQISISGKSAVYYALRTEDSQEKAASLQVLLASCRECLSQWRPGQEIINNIGIFPHDHEKSIKRWHLLEQLLDDQALLRANNTEFADTIQSYKVTKERCQQAKRAHLTKWLSKRDKLYDLSDCNRALRQAVSINDIEAILFLVWIAQADPMHQSPSGKSTQDYLKEDQPRVKSIINTAMALHACRAKPNSKQDEDDIKDGQEQQRDAQYKQP